MSVRVSGPKPEASEVVAAVEPPAADRAVSHGGKVIECFDATSSAVFASLCRVTVGDGLISERLLIDTYGQLQRGPARTIDLAGLISLANHNYLIDARANLSRPVPPPHDDTSWTAAAWRGLAPDALAALTAEQRVALNLFEVEGFPLTDIAECLGVPVEELEQVVADAHRSLAHAGADDSVGDLFRQCEIWLDDTTRDRVRGRVADRKGRPAESGDTEADAAPRASRVRVALVVVAVLIGTAAVVRWIGTSPDQNGEPISFAVPSTEGDSAAPSDANASDPARASEAAGREPTRLILNPADGVVVADMPWTSVTGSTGESMVVLAPELTDPQPVTPDAIVRYSNGKIGLSWRGPCNRPAATVQFSDVPNGTGLQLMTGAFDVVACTGMPDRWTTVVDPPVALSDGPILPIVDGHLDAGFHGLSDVAAPDDPRTRISASRAGYGSALVDAGNSAWVYVNGCKTIDAIRYQSPVGAIFEVQTPDADLTYCVPPSPTQLLRGPGDRQFPQPLPSQGTLEQPIDCRGPYGSQLDVSPDPTFTAEFHDGDWTTWDFCRVRSNVIFSRAYDDCGLPGARTITFATDLGRTILNAREQTYLRDPNGVVPGEHFPTLFVPGLPETAHDTGLRHGRDELWISPESPPVIYVVTADAIERWPLVDAAPRCG